jgi:hypothetical protein
MKKTGGLSFDELNHFLTMASAAMTTAATMLRSSRVFTASIMTRIAYVAPSISRLVCVEMAKRLFPARWCWSSITMPRIVVVVYVTVEAMRTVEPRTSPDEQSSTEPIRSIVAVGRTPIGGIVIIAIGTSRFRSNGDADLSRGSRAANERQSGSKSE